SNWNIVEDDFLADPLGPIPAFSGNLPLTLSHGGLAGRASGQERTDESAYASRLRGSVANPASVGRKNPGPLVKGFAQQPHRLVISLKRQHPQVVSGVGRVLRVVQQESPVVGPTGGIEPRAWLPQQDPFFASA